MQGGTLPVSTVASELELTWKNTPNLLRGGAKTTVRTKYPTTKTVGEDAKDQV